MAKARLEFRLDYILSHQGYGMPRNARRLIQQHVVTVNGIRAASGGLQINTNTDVISIDGKPLTLAHDIYLMMNKPPHTVCTTKSDWNPTVYSLLPEEYRAVPECGSLQAVGRLDKDTEGLLLFTTDGRLAYKLTAPQYHIPKTYYVRLRDAVTPAERGRYTEQLAAGMQVPEAKYGPAFLSQPASLVWCSTLTEAAVLCGTSASSPQNGTAGTQRNFCEASAPSQPAGAVCRQNVCYTESAPVQQISASGEQSDCFTAGAAAMQNTAVCRITVSEGKYHEVKRLFAALGNEVVYLKRIACGGVELDAALAPGGCRPLTQQEIDCLRSAAELCLFNDADGRDGFVI